MMTLGPYELNTIVTGDCRELAEAIPSESVDLIFTDPVYWLNDDYEWLAKLAYRILTLNGVALIWTGTIYERQCLKALEVALIHRLTLNYIVVGNTAMDGGSKAFLWRSPLFWMDKSANTQPNKWITDTVVSTSATNGTHKWNKNPEAIIKWLDAFTQPDSIVFDPFTGGGTVPAVCKMLGRNYLAFEIDPATADKARQRVLLTQPPLFVAQPEQVPMFV